MNQQYNQEERYAIVPSDSDSSSFTRLHKEPSEANNERISDAADIAQAIGQVFADYQSRRDAEETRRIEIEAYYRERMERYSRDLDVLVEEMREQSKNQMEYMRSVLSLSHRMLDEGYPDQSVLIYETFVNDSKRKNLMDYLIEYYERVSPGKVTIQADPHHFNESI